MTPSRSLLLLMVSFTAAAAATAVTRKVAKLDRPNRRSLHANPTPRGGGFSIALIVLAGHALLSPQGEGILGRFSPFLISASIITLIGLLEDIYTLPIRVRFAGHSLAALIIIFKGYPLSIVTLSPGCTIDLSIAAQVLSFFWIVGLTNAFNFMDGIDGISATQAILAGCGWTYLGWATSRTDIMLIGLLITSASAGFLTQNWPPAKIFLGDVGSYFLGFTFAVLPFLSSQETHRDILYAVILLWPFIFDSIFTFIRRLIHRENVLQAHRSHLYQRLILSGSSHREVTSLYGALAFIGLVATLVTHHVLSQDFRPAILLLLFCGGILVLFVRRKESHKMS